jgi:hypothetical protein
LVAFCTVAGTLPPELSGDGDPAGGIGLPDPVRAGALERTLATALVMGIWPRVLPTDCVVF